MDNLLKEMIAHEGGLAGVASREDFASSLNQQWKRHERSGLPLSLVMAEIDYFCQFQWSSGILASDECLDAMATAILESVRLPGVEVFAWGPGRFAVLLPETSMLEAARVAEEIRFQCDALVLPHPCSPVANSVTVTTAVATARPATGISAFTLPRDAEQGLTTARSRRRTRGGRRVVMA